MKITLVSPLSCLGNYSMVLSQVNFYCQSQGCGQIPVGSKLVEDDPCRDIRKWLEVDWVCASK